MVNIVESKLLKETLEAGDLFFEKCELKKAHEQYSTAVQLSKKAKDFYAVFEALTALIRMGEEAGNSEEILKWEKELDRVMVQCGKKLPPMAWYAKAALARHAGDLRLAQRYFHRYLRQLRQDLKPQSDSAKTLTRETSLVRAWAMLAITTFQRGHTRRAESLAQILLARYEHKKLKRINGNLYLILARIAEKEKDLNRAEEFYRKSHAGFLAEHNWYYHLHVLIGYARIARMRQQYSQAYWYLELVNQAASGPEFGRLKKEVQVELSRLEKDAVDLLIDGQKGVIKTRESGAISVRKQYVLLNILEALSNAKSGLSKGEIIEKVWKEKYRPEAHDNKLYYNINRLRKLIEPDTKNPQYLLNWREGYRLAPGLRIHCVGSKTGAMRLES